MIIAVLLLILCCVFFIMVGFGYYFISNKNDVSETISTEQEEAETVTPPVKEVDSGIIPEGTYAINTKLNTGTQLYCKTGLFSPLLYCDTKEPCRTCIGSTFTIKKAPDAPNFKQGEYVTIQDDKGKYCIGGIGGGTVSCDSDNPGDNRYNITKSRESGENLYIIKEVGWGYLNIGRQPILNDSYMTGFESGIRTKFSIVPKESPKEVLAKLGK